MSDDNELIYLKIPVNWTNTYNKLLYLVSLVGKDLITNCMCNCSNKCNSVFQCWNMFQSALAANELHEDKKAETLINFIDGQLRILYRNYNIVMPDIDYSKKYIRFGSDKSNDVNEITINDFTKDDISKVINTELTIETTEEKPYVWFVSDIPLMFKQASIVCDMYEHYIDGLYYYNTDALIPGNDNKYYIYMKKSNGTEI